MSERLIYHIGPFTQEKFDQSKWKNIKDKIFQLNSTNEEQTFGDCAELYQLLREINASSNLDQYFGEQNIKNYFIGDYMITNAKNLIATKTFINPNLLHLSNKILEEMIMLWYKTFEEDNSKLADLPKMILDPNRSYFKFNDQEDASRNILPAYMKPNSLEHLQWIANLKQGDEVDCIKLDSSYSKQCWAPAVVDAVMESHLRIVFMHDRDISLRYLEHTTNAYEIAPRGTKAKDFDWRLTLKVGDEIDACDVSHVWYNATVVAVKETPLTDDKVYKEVKVGYRIYRPDGDKTDYEDNKYFGLQSKYDEYLSVTSPRIAKFGTMARKLYLGPVSINEDTIIDDTNDKVIFEEGKTIYAVLRNGRTNTCKSIFIIDLVNKLGEMGLFEKILKRISDADNWAPIEVVSNIITVLGQLHLVFHKDFCMDYVPKLKEAVWRNLIKSPDNNIRNFSKERIDAILNGFDWLFRRVYSIPEKYEMLETLNLEICSICFEANFLDKKLQGLKTLLEVIKNLRFGNLKFTTHDVLKKFIVSHGIFDKIYGSKGHVALIQRSADFLKYMINECNIGSDELAIVWSATIGRDTETKLSVYKLLQDIALHFKPEHLELVIKKIAEIPPSDFIPDEIELIYEMTRFSVRTSGFTKKARDLFWTIISEKSKGFSNEIVELALTKFCDIMKSWELKDEKMNVLYNCVENVESRVSVLVSVKIMKKIIDNYPISQASSEKFNKVSAIEHLCKEKNLISALVSELKAFKANIKVKLNDSKPTEAKLDALCTERASYVSHVNERLQFIHYLLSNSESQEISLTYDLLSELWDVIVNDALINSEKDVVYKWIKETAESKAGFPMSINDLSKFYKEKMNNQDSAGMTIEGFSCFKNVFLIINDKLTRISKVEAQENRNKTHYDYEYSSDEKVQKDFDYKVNVVPNELEGIQSIWDFIFSSENEAVAEKVIDFINKLYQHVNSQLEDKLASIREDYISTCIKHLKTILSNKDKLSETAFSAGCLRVLALIRTLMDESEKKGVGNLTSHSALVKGELLNFSVANDMTSGTDVPKKVELRLHANMTVFELRVEVGKHFKGTWDQVKLSRSGNKEIKDMENGKTIGEIRIRNGENLTAAKRPTPPIPQVQLVNSDGVLHPLAKKVFVDWFETFSENGKMSPDGCARFIHSCTMDYCKAEDKRVKEVFEKNDTDRDGFLTMDNFLEFYYGAAKNRPHVVWNNLHAHHYRNDLRKAAEVEEEKVDIKALARSIIKNDPENYALLFSLLDFGGKVATEAWKLLNRLPTSSEIFVKIVKLDGVRDTENKNWDSILDSSSTYRMLYALQVLEYLMEDEGDEENSENPLWSSDAKLLEQKKNWRADFIILGGFDHLFKIFNKLAQKDHTQLNMFEKNILSFILQILKDYLMAAFATQVPNIYRNLSFIKLFHLSLDFISDYLDSSEMVRLQKALSFEQSQKTAVTGELDENGLPTMAKTTSKKVVFDSDTIIEGAPEPEIKMVRKDSKAEEKKKEKMKIEETEEFKNLVDRLRGDLASKIIATINLKDFIKLISTLGFDLLTTIPDLESEDRTIIEHSLIILVGILLYDNKYIDYFLNLQKSGLENSDNYMLEGIFCSKSVNVRKYFSHALYILCKNTNDYSNAAASKHFMNLFLQNLPSSENDSRKDCMQFFDILCKIIEETYSKPSKSESKDDFNFENLISLTVNQIRNHVSIETRNNTSATDKIFIGLLQLCEKILIVKPHLREIVGSSKSNNLVEEIFNTALFDVQERDNTFKDYIGENDPNSFGKNYVKCKSKDSRSVAYKLLIALCKNSSSNTIALLGCLHQLMLSMLKTINVSSSWNHSPSNDSRSHLGYAGIKNLGCICYMNAMLQQFFMTPTFRYGVLLADDKVEPNIIKKDGKFDVDDNVIHQLQQMFGFLELSDRLDYNPHEFCFSFKDYSGSPVNVSIQQDTQEFLNNIFDKLDTNLKHTPLKNILDSVYGGRFSNQMICHGCGKIRERIENFYNLSVEVKNLKTVYESFDKFITGETIEDFFCDSCNTKNNITKRACIGNLPNVLIVHLQRLVFDFDTLMNQKINSRLEFPFELNMEPYTKEGLEWRDKAKKNIKKEATTEEEEKDDGAQAEEEPGPYKKHPKEYYEYKLSGVVVHVGSAEAGHYYSYINTNRGDPSKSNPKNDKWLEFNDSHIREFDTKNIDNECFGGASSDNSDDAWTWVKAGRENSKSAYILVYERVVKDPLKLVIHKEEDEAYLRRCLEVDQVVAKKPDAVRIVEEEEGEEGNKKLVKNFYLDYYSLKKFVPSNVYKKVWEDNHRFMFERHIYHEDFFKFIKDVCNSVLLIDFTKDAQGQKNLEKFSYFLFYLVFCLLGRASENSTLTEIANNLKNIISLAPQCGPGLLENMILRDPKNIFELWLNCPEKNVRAQTSQIILHLLNVIINHYKLELNEEKLKATEAVLDTLSDEEKFKWKIEDNIVKFLNYSIGIMPHEVAKNWLKMCQYFEFWRDFARSGETQVEFLFRKEFIAVLIDFYLEKRSPLKDFAEKKHSIGNRYTDPEFNPLIQTVSYLISRTRLQVKVQPPNSLVHQGFKLFEPSQNDFACIYCSDFYEKTLKEKYDFVAFGQIVQMISYENENCSYVIANYLLKGLTKPGYDEAKSYLESMTYFLNIDDSIKTRRIEWILGYAQPNVIFSKNGLPGYGIYGVTSLDDLVIKYASTLNIDGTTSVMNTMLGSRRTSEHLSMLCLKQILILADLNPAMFEYLFWLPAPNYLYAKFIDWIPGFIEYYIAESKKYYHSSNKEELAIEVDGYFKKLEQRVNKRLEDLNKGFVNLGYKNEPDQVEEEKNKENKIFKTLGTPYIIGQTYKEEELERKYYDEQQKVCLVTTQEYCFITESKPTGSTNLGLPQSVINDGKLRTMDIPNECAVSFFVQPKLSSYAKFHNSSVTEYHPSHPMSSAIEQAIASQKKSAEEAGFDYVKTESFEDGKEEQKGQEGNTNQKVVQNKDSVDLLWESPFIDDATFEYELNPVIRRHYISNDSTHYLNVHFKIIPKGYDFLNFRLPSSKIIAQVKPKSMFNLVILTKIFSDMGWGDYDYSLEIYPDNNVAAYSNSNYSSGNNSNNNTRQNASAGGDDFM